MKRWYASLMLVFSLFCMEGVGFAQTAPVFDGNGLHIQRSALATDGYANTALEVDRDTTATSGGTPGYVNPGILVHSSVGRNVNSFEWAGVFILDNYSSAGENVAAYFQANKFGTGPIWGAVSEATDTTGSSSGQVAQEFDVWTYGPDSGNRIGLDVLVGDARAIRGLGTNGVAQASTGVRIGATTASPYAFWTRGIQLKDRMLLGIDTSAASIDTGTALRMAYGQAIAFDAYDSAKMVQQNGRIKVLYQGQPVFEIDLSTGDVYKKGVKVY